MIQNIFGGKMSYQISKYEALKAVLTAEETNQKKLAAKMMQAIRRATRNEIKQNVYTKIYIINEEEKKCFERVSCVCTAFSRDDK